MIFISLNHENAGEEMRGSVSSASVVGSSSRVSISSFRIAFVEVELANLRRYSDSADPVCSTNTEKQDPAFDSNASAESNSTTRPSLSTYNKTAHRHSPCMSLPTMMRSLSITVRSRCATVSTVHSRNASRIDRWISSSVLQSTAHLPTSSLAQPSGLLTRCRRSLSPRR